MYKQLSSCWSVQCTELESAFYCMPCPLITDGAPRMTQLPAYLHKWHKNINIYTLNPVEAIIEMALQAINRDHPKLHAYLCSIHMHAYTLTHNGSEALGGSLLLSSDWINIRNQWWFIIGLCLHVYIHVNALQQDTGTCTVNVQVLKYIHVVSYDCCHHYEFNNLKSVHIHDDLKITIYTCTCTCM